VIMTTRMMLTAVWMGKVVLLLLLLLGLNSSRQLLQQSAALLRRCRRSNVRPRRTQALAPLPSVPQLTPAAAQATATQT
jgi:hypothetical protein